MPIDIRMWMYEFTKLANQTFGPRIRLIGLQGSYAPVSYTHLDVYKRQPSARLIRGDRPTVYQAVRRSSCGVRRPRMCIRMSGGSQSLGNVGPRLQGSGGVFHPSPQGTAQLMPLRIHRRRWRRSRTSLSGRDRSHPICRRFVRFRTSS